VKADAPVDGFLLVDKSGGWTSHDVVAKLRGITGIRKIGHAGTLDPMATGLLAVGIGRATRLLRFVQDAPKTYVATAMFGVATESLDADGAVLSREPMPVTVEDVEQVLGRFVGEIPQVPPMVSARKVEGRRLYELAREGKTVEREARAVEIHRLQVVDFAPSDYPEVTFEVDCSKGTYVRTLADDLARALGGRAHLVSLRRTAIGSLRVENAPEIDAYTSEGWRDSLLTPSAGLADLPAVQLDDDLARAVSHGVPVAGHRLGDPDTGPLRMLDAEGRLLAVYRADGARASAEVVLS
jgi:tRNA pseudouridine55 synthase